MTVRLLENGVPAPASLYLCRAARPGIAGVADAWRWAPSFYQRPEIVAATSKLANFGAFGFASTVYEDIGFKKS